MDALSTQPAPGLDLTLVQKEGVAAQGLVGDETKRNGPFEAQGIPFAPEFKVGTSHLGFPGHPWGPSDLLLLPLSLEDEDELEKRGTSAKSL